LAAGLIGRSRIQVAGDLLQVFFQALEEINLGDLQDRVLRLLRLSVPEEVV